MPLISDGLAIGKYWYAGRKRERNSLLSTAKSIALTSEVLLITDGEKGVAAAGVMGGLHSEVSDDTTDILLESAYFDSVTIRKSRIKLGMASDSSVRFEKGADPNIVPEAINRAAYLIQKYAGGELLRRNCRLLPKYDKANGDKFSTGAGQLYSGNKNVGGADA